MCSKLLLPAILATGFSLQATPVFDTIHGGDQTYFSQNYSYYDIAELGDRIAFAGADRNLNTVSVLLNQGAFGFTGDYTHAITLNLYSGKNNTDLLFSRTVDQLITSTGVFQVDFDFNGVTVPNSLYYGVSFRTSREQNGDLRDGGAYDSLGFVLWDLAGPGSFDGPVKVGTDLSNGMYWRHRMNGGYEGAGTSTNAPWLKEGFTGAIEFDAGRTPISDVSGVPEPGTFVLLGLGLVGIGIRVRPRSPKPQSTNNN